MWNSRYQQDLNKEDGNVYSAEGLARLVDVSTTPPSASTATLTKDEETSVMEGSTPASQERSEYADTADTDQYYLVCSMSIRHLSQPFFQTSQPAF